MAEPYVGEVRIFGGNFPPAGWMFCNGQLLSISDYETLFTLIGTTYGGDGQSTFALPNLVSRIPVGQGSGPAGSRILGEAAGQESVSLTTQQMPSHTHTLLGSDAPATSSSPAGKVWATAADTRYSTTPPNATMDPASLSSAGGGQPHENRAPALGLNFIIALNGIFPSQSRPAKEAHHG